MTRDDIIALTIRLEGGYVNNPRDPGGPTNMGITQRYLDHYNASKRPSDPTMPASVRDLSVEDVTSLYEADQWVTTGAEKVIDMSPGLAAVLFDTGVNQGPGTAVGFLQDALGLRADKLVGPTTLAAASVAVARKGAPALIMEFTARRANYYASLNSYNAAGFELGWMRRLLTVYTAAIK